jgi:APA family basic amino acid/polyamine antiporter
LLMSTSPQKIKLFSLTMIAIGFVIGMGIFRAAATSAKDALTPGVYFTAWIVGGLVALCGALTYAEIGSRFPATGGYYKVFAKAYHPSIAFAINCLILVSNAASVSGVVLIGTGYLSKLFGDSWSDVDKALAGCGALILFYFINLRGLILSSRAQNILMMIKISMVLVLIAALFFPDKYAAGTDVFQATDTNPAWTDWVQSLGLALVAVSFTYGGYQQSINFGPEVENPSRNLPKGIITGILVVVVLYLLVNLSYYNIVGFDRMKGEKEIAYVVIDKIFGSNGAKVFSVFLFLGVLAYVNGSLLSNPRVMYAMGEDRSLPAVFSKKNPQTNVLAFSLTVFTIICMTILFFSQQFDKILTFSIFLDCFGMILSAATIFWFRKKTKHLDSTGIYKMKLFPLMPVIFIAAYLFVGISIVIADPSAALLGVGLLAAFIVIYLVVHQGRGKISQSDNEITD